VAPGVKAGETVEFLMLREDWKNPDSSLNRMAPLCLRDRVELQ